MNLQEHALKLSWCSVYRFLHKSFTWFVVVEDGRLTGKHILMELVQRKNTIESDSFSICAYLGSVGGNSRLAYAIERPFCINTAQVSPGSRHTQ